MSELKKFLGNLTYYAFCTFIVLLILAFFVGMYLLDKWRWSCN
jgi:hypothetical protein